MPCPGRAPQPIATSSVNRKHAEFGTRPRRGGAGNFARARVGGCPGEELAHPRGRGGIHRMRNGAGTRWGGGGAVRFARGRGKVMALPLLRAKIVTRSRELDGRNGRGKAMALPLPLRKIVTPPRGIDDRNGDSRVTVAGCDAHDATRHSIIRIPVAISSRCA
jgi:hypothetical protein